jgi:hypothetical protein
MSRTAADVLSELSQITNINNIKYNNNNNNTSIVSDESNEVKKETQFPVGLASRKALGEAFASSGTLPANWRGVKLDLFSNPGYTLKITIVRHDGTRFACSSNLNSPRSYVFRGKDQGQGTDIHWWLVEDLMAQREGMDYKISKVNKPRKGGTLNDFAAMIYLKDDVWHAELIYEYKVWQFALNRPISEEFKNNRGIATGYFGVTTTNKPWQDPKELGI